MNFKIMNKLFKDKMQGKAKIELLHNSKICKLWRQQKILSDLMTINTLTKMLLKQTNKFKKNKNSNPQIKKNTKILNFPIQNR